jgi:hypothetical protein
LMSQVTGRNRSLASTLPLISLARERSSPAAPLHPAFCASVDVTSM